MATSLLSFAMAVTLSGIASQQFPIERISFNQNEIERDLGLVDRPADAMAAEKGPYASFEDPVAVLRGVIELMPAEAVVYPSERYYYYQFVLGPQIVSGNLRFTDIEEGQLHIGYFDIHERHIARTATFDERNGLKVEQTGPSSYRISFGGAERQVTLATAYLDARGVELGEGEEAVTGLLDESGWEFVLAWVDGEAAFRFIVKQDACHPERLAPLAELGGRMVIGVDSRMVFWRDDAGRLVLVGVLADMVARNTRYDGPFDQVPPRLRLRDKLERAYPYVEGAGGIDLHGNFADREGYRVAISPYRQYRAIAELTSVAQHLLESGRGDEIVQTLTFEQKRLPVDSDRMPGLHEVVFRSALGRSANAHLMWLSQGWPANHHGWVSGMWPSDHDESVSAGAAPNSVPPRWGDGGANGPARAK